MTSPPILPVLLGPYVVALYEPPIIPAAFGFAAVGAYAALRWRPATTASRRLRIAALALASYVAACQILAFLVDRADRDFQRWLWEERAGISEGMLYDEAWTAAARRCTLHSPPYFSDSFGAAKVFAKDWVVKPRGLASLHLVRRLMREYEATLTIVSDRDDKVVAVHVSGLDPTTVKIITRR